MKLKLVRKQLETDNVWSFFFEPAEPLAWVAGQSVRIEIPRKTWGYDERRFTIASAPSEGRIRITTRLSGSEFKQALAALQPGETVDGHNIEGSFIWEPSPPKLLLAAGIGITPFRAMLKAHAPEEDVKLLYQSKDQPPVFGDELSAWLDDALTITPDRLSFDSIAAFCPDWQQRLVYISGPEQMVQTLSRQLQGAGLPAGQLKTDLFTGFDTARS